MDLNLREINYVLSINAKGTITKAAQDLHVAQPSLTQALQKLENRLKTPLFYRSKNQMKLTYAGERFIEAGLKIIKISRDLENELQDVSNLDAGRIVLGITLYLSSYMFIKIKQIYREIHPNVEIKLIERNSSELENMVLSGEVDTAILPSVEKPVKGIEFIRIFKANILLMMPKQHWLNEHLYRKKGVDLPYIDIRLAAEEPFLLTMEGQRMREAAEEIFRRAKISPPIIFESRSIETIKRLSAAGIGLAFIPDYYKNFINTNEGETYCYIDDQYAPKWNVSIVYQSKSAMSKPLAEFVSVVKQNFGDSFCV